jgi:hypothetical protein
VLIPFEYFLQKFYQHAGYPQFKKNSNTYIAGCPICREGKSWGKKRRCVYIVDDNAICCHNCGWYSDPIKWITEVTGLRFNEILNESKEFDILPLNSLISDSDIFIPKTPHRLPADCINIFDSNQIKYFNNNTVIRDAVSLVKKRRLDTAINRPDALFVSLNDKVHKNRIIIPFYNENNEVIFYQTRLIYDKDAKLYPKYLSKINGEKSLYNINKISEELDYIFIFEGPIDAFFVKNGIAVAGIQENSHNTFSALQQKQLSLFPFYKKIWVLDSQWQDKASKTKTKKLIDSGERVFIWPEDLGKSYKDVNEYCIDKNFDNIDPGFFIENSHQGLKANLLSSVICR